MQAVSGYCSRAISGPWAPFIPLAAPGRWSRHSQPCALSLGFHRVIPPVRAVPRRVSTHADFRARRPSELGAAERRLQACFIFVGEGGSEDGAAGAGELFENFVGGDF